MITRLVKLEFEEDRIEDFLTFFEGIKNVVNSFEGCHGMKLYRDTKNSNIVMTYSHWVNEEALNRYRDSKEFGMIWPKIKPWFKSKPQAWTMKTHFNGFEESN